MGGVAQRVCALMDDVRREISELAEVQNGHAPPSQRLLTNLDQIAAALAVLKNGTAVGPKRVEAFPA